MRATLVLVALLGCAEKSREADAGGRLTGPGPGPGPGSGGALCGEAGCLEFAEKTIDGEVVRSGDFRGKALLVLVWASWCEPCTQEGPSLNEVYSRRKDEFALLGVSKDEVGEKEMRDFRDRHHIRYPIVMANEALLKRLGEPAEIPQFLLYGKDGKLRWKMSGSLPASVLERELDALQRE